MVPLIMLFYQMMLMPVLMLSYDQESHAAPYIYYLDLKCNGAIYDAVSIMLP